MDEEPETAAAVGSIHSSESNRYKSAEQLAMEAEAEMAEEEKYFASYRSAWESRCGSRGRGFFQDMSGNLGADPGATSGRPCRSSPSRSRR